MSRGCMNQRVLLRGQEPRLRVSQGRLRHPRRRARRKARRLGADQDQAAEHRRAALSRDGAGHLSRQRPARPPAADKAAAAQRQGHRLRQRDDRRLSRQAAIGSGATRTGRRIRWACFTRRARRASCPAGGLDPARGVDLTYFTGDNGFARADSQNARRRADLDRRPGGPARCRGPRAAALRLCEDQGRRWPSIAAASPSGTTRRTSSSESATLQPDVPLYPDGHPLLVIARQATDYVYFASSVSAGAGAGDRRELPEPGPVRSLSPASSPVRRCEGPKSTATNQAACGTAGRTARRRSMPRQQAKLVKSGKLTAEKGCCNCATRRPASRCSPIASGTAWNEYRRKWT